MTINSKISVADYNAIQTVINAVMGPGGFVPGTTTVDPSYGYGQVRASTQVTESNIVSVSDWTKLVNDIDNTSRHQTGSAATLVSIAENDVIRAAGGNATIVGSISGNILTVTSVSNSSTTGMIVPGMTLTGTGVTSPTTIQSLVSGSPWGASTWTISQSYTLSSRTFTGTISADFPKSNYLVAINSLATATNRFRLHSSRSILANKGGASIDFPGGLGTSWNSTLSTTITVTFTTATQARYFFNSGGEIRFSTSRSGGTATSQNQSWTNILNNASAAVPSFGAIKPATGLTPSNGQNFYRLSGSYTVWYTISGSSPYGSNTFRISARCPGVTNNSTGTARTIEFLLEYVDSYTDPGPGGPPFTDDLVNGTFNVAVTTLEATGALTPPALGTVTVETPTVTYGTWAATSVSAPPASSPPTTITPPSSLGIITGFANDGGAITTGSGPRSQVNIGVSGPATGNYNYSVTGPFTFDPLTGNTTSGTLTLPSPNTASINFVRPHSSGTITVTISRTGYTPFSQTVSIPARS